MTKPLNPVLGGNLEDLHYVELECQLLHKVLLNPVPTLGASMTAPSTTTTRSWNVNDLLHCTCC